MAPGEMILWVFDATVWGARIRLTMCPGVDIISGLEDEYLQYGDHTIPGSYGKALDDLESLVDQEGPFDGVMTFSQGAGLAAALMVRKLRQDPHHARLNPIFRCAIFFCGGVPLDPSISDDGKAASRLLSFEADGELIHIPSAHIWGAHDRVYPTFGPVLSKLCCSDQRADFIHQGGHEIPGPKDQEGVLNAIRVIQRAIQRANEGQ